MTIALSLGHRTVTVSGQTQIVNEKGKKVALSLVYPPPHLYHILFELFKNSMRAVVESHGTRSELPNIEVLVAKGEHDVSIRVSDQVGYHLKERGGGRGGGGCLQKRIYWPS